MIRLAKSCFDFFIFTSLFIAVCAVAMAWQSCTLFGEEPSVRLLLFIFCGTVTSYNFHWYLTPPREEGSLRLRWSVSNKILHLGLFLLGAVASVVCFFLVWEHWPWLALSVLLSFLYSAPKIPHPLFYRLRKIAVGKTIFLAFAWTHVTAVLPLVTAGDGQLDTSAVIFVANRFFFIYAICILFDYRDRAEDRTSGIRSLIIYLDERGIDRLFWGSVLVYVLTLGWLARSFALMEVIALLIPGLILSLLYYPSKKNFSDYRYYFVLDGLMMLSAPLLVLSKFAR
jgi:4-hydroxybenzoate polyprenyltransferase